MVTKRTRKSKLDQLDRPLLEQLMLGEGRVRRFTQDTPVLPDVWLAYANLFDDGRPVPRAYRGSRRAHRAAWDRTNSC